MTSSDDGGYVHDPSQFDGEGERAEAGADDPATRRPVHPDAVDREFDWRGWVLVAVVVFAFLVAPALVLWRPPQLPYYVALLILPLAPAILLGVVAVWATTRP